MPNDSLTELLASYVPRLIQRRVIKDPSPIESPVTEDFQAAVLFADISGFTILAERLAEKDPSGAETLARILSEYFGQLIDIIHEYGGDVVKFAGDAMIAIWLIDSDLDMPEIKMLHDLLQQGNTDSASRENQWQWTMRAAECALRIRERLTNYKAEGANLYLKLAVSTGSISTAHVGGVFNRWEFLLTGVPLVELGIANNLANAGEILVTPSAWRLIRHDSMAQPIEFELKDVIAQGGRLHRLNKPSSVTPSSIKLNIPDGAEGSLRAYIPGAIINRLTAGQSGWIAELRRVTVLFINLPDLNQATQLDLGQSVARSIQHCVYRYEGSINKINVDDKGITVVAALGLPPLAHEDDPVRGVQAALMVRKELTSLGVKSYIGVATGRIFCGAIGNSSRREYTIIGNSVNLSARLMGAAERMSAELAKETVPILCDRVTYDDAKEAVDFESFPPQYVKGRSEAVEVFHPIEQKKTVIRPKTELIGRQEEKALIANALQELQRGAARQSIIFHGEAGIGKSRLTEEFIRQARLLGVKTFLGAGDSIEQNNPYFSWRTVFNQLFGIEDVLSRTELSASDHEAIQAAVLSKLDEVDPELTSYAPLLNVVLPIALPENELTIAMMSEVRGGNIRELLVRLLNYETASSKLLIAVEDLHWLDSASWALLSDVHQKVRPLILMMSTRPLDSDVTKEFQEILEAKDTRFVKLDAMLFDDVESLACQRLGVKSVPPEIGRLIREKSEGHPFFAEELAYALRDSGVLTIQNEESYITPGFTSLENISLPENLQAAITSRIDSLIPSQQLVLKVASIIGRIFAMRVLEAVHPIEADKPLIPENLNTLTRMSLTLIESKEPDLLYIFKHALTQQVAYNLMLYAQRRQLHQAVAEWIERSYEREIATYYSLLAYHWIRTVDDPEPERRGKVIRKTADYLEKAGDQSLNNYANKEAIQFFSDLLRFKDAVEPSKLQLGQWYRKLGISHLGLGHLDDAKRNFLKALSVLGQHVPASGAGMIGSLLWQMARQTSHRIFPGFHRGRASDPQKEAIRMEIVQILQEYATVLFLIGDPNPLPMFHSVLTGLNTAETIRDTAELAYMYAQMGAVCGFIPARKQAHYYTEQWRSLNEQIYNANYFVGSVIALATVESGIGAWKELQVRLEKVIEICNSLGNNRQAGEALSFLTSNAIMEGNVQLIEYYNARLLENATRRNHPVQMVWHYQWAGSTALRSGSMEEALEYVNSALAIMQKTPVGEVAEFTIHGIRLEALWHVGKQSIALSEAKSFLERAYRLQVVDYGIYVGFQPMTGVIFLALEKAERENHFQAKKDELMKYARLSVKIMRAYAHVFTVGEPAAYYYHGWVEWYSGRKDKAYQSWRRACEKAQAFPMYYECGMSYLALGNHLPVDSAERSASLEKAQEAFKRGGFDHWAEVTHRARET